MLRAMSMKPLMLRLSTAGLVLRAIALEVDKLEAVPEFQRAWYVPDGAKFKLDPAKVDVEDVTSLKNAAVAARRERDEGIAKAEKAKADALKAFEGIDPVRAREILAMAEDAEEAKLLAKGKEGLDLLVAKKMQKREADLVRQVEEANAKAQSATEKLSKREQKVLDGEIRAAATKAGLHPAAIDDALLRARAIFTLDGEDKPIQYDKDGKTVIMGKDNKTPFSPGEWMEEMRKSAPHWFPSSASGGGAGGGGGGGGGKDMSGMSPTARMTAAREQGKKK